MNKKLFFLIPVLFINLEAVFANTEEDLNLENLKISPQIVSPTGKNKIRDHIQILNQNISLTRTNLTSTTKNISVIEVEIKELDGLAQEHLNLKKRYLDFLSTVQKENAKNDKALADILTFEKKATLNAPDSKNPNQLAELEAAKAERQAREDWKKEAEQRSTRIKELLGGIEKNLQSIESRKVPLTEQLKTWQTRLTEYQTILNKLNQKKQDAERFIASKKQDLTE